MNKEVTMSCDLIEALLSSVSKSKARWSPGTPIGPYRFKRVQCENCPLPRTLPSAWVEGGEALVPCIKFSVPA